MGNCVEGQLSGRQLFSGQLSSGRGKYPVGNFPLGQLFLEAIVQGANDPGGII